MLANHLGALENLGGREFSDPGFLAFALAEYARAVDDRGLLAGARKFVDRAFGMKVPTSFAGEPAAAGGLFDFSSTTATRILAVVAAEGPTPFVGAWLRERVAASVPNGFTPRRLDENTWNACAAWALGRAYVVSTDPVFMQAYSDTMDELERRDADRDGALRARPDRAGGGDGADVLLRARGRRAGDARERERGAGRGRGRAWPLTGRTPAGRRREELRAIVGQLRTHLEARGRSGLWVW